MTHPHADDYSGYYGHGYAEEFAYEPHYDHYEQPYAQYSDYGMQHYPQYDGYYDYQAHQEHWAEPIQHEYHEYTVVPPVQHYGADYDHMYSAGWGYDPYDPYHVDPRHHNMDYGYPYVGYYLDNKDSNDTQPSENSIENSTENSSSEPAEDQYLALFGAKELFGQLAQEGNPHERRRRGGRRRPHRNGDEEDNEVSDNEADNANPNCKFRENCDSNDSTASNSEEVEAIAIPQMNLFGASELFAQLARDKPQSGRERKPWRRSNEVVEEDPQLVNAVAQMLSMQ